MTRTSMYPNARRALECCDEETRLQRFVPYLLVSHGSTTCSMLNVKAHTSAVIHKT